VWHYPSETARLVFADTGRRTDLQRLADYAAACGGGTRNEIYNRTGAGVAEHLE
jgi:hypothetical protein